MDKNAGASRLGLFRKKRLDSNGNKHNNENSYYLILGGILSFFGLDEDSKRDRKYEREIESNTEDDFDEKLKKILRPAIVNMQVGNIILINNRKLGPSSGVASLN